MTTTVPPKLSQESVSLLLESAQNEYNHEKVRIANHDAKMNIILPTSVAYLLAILSSSQNLAIIMSSNVTTVQEAILPIMALVSFLVSLTLAVIAIIKMFLNLLPKSYIVIDTRDLYDFNYLSKPNQILFQLRMHQKYLDAADKNREQNNKRMIGHRHACVLMVISIFAIVVYNLINAFINKGA